MLSQQKTDANRENAKKSTGPRTDLGKMISAQNARQHGLSAADLYIPADRQSEFNQMKSNYLAEINPVGQIQQDLFDQLLHAAWNLRTARRLFAKAMAEEDFKQADRFQRYINQHERGYQRALSQIKATQTDRAVRCIPEHQHLESLPDTVSPGPVIAHLIQSAKRTQSAISFHPSPPLASAQTNPQAPPQDQAA